MTFEYPTNYSNGSIVDGVGDFFFGYPSHIISQFGAGIILLIWLLSFGISYYLGANKSLLFASFISFVFSVYLSSRGLLNPIISIILIIMVIIGLIGSKNESVY